MSDFRKEVADFGPVGLPYKDEFGTDFICEYCKKKNKVVMDFFAVKTMNRKK